MMIVDEADTCYSLSFHPDFFCDQCKYFQDRIHGLTGRKPSKNAIPECEKPWFLKIASCPPPQAILRLEEHHKKPHIKKSTTIS